MLGLYNGQTASPRCSNCMSWLFTESIFGIYQDSKSQILGVTEPYKLRTQLPMETGELDKWQKPAAFLKINIQNVINDMHDNQKNQTEEIE